MDAELKEYRESMSQELQSPHDWQRYSERMVALQEATDARMLASASSILSQSQLDALRERFRQTLARLEADQRLQRIQVNLTTPAPAAQ